MNVLHHNEHVKVLSSELCGILVPPELVNTSEFANTLNDFLSKEQKANAFEWIVASFFQCQLAFR